LFLYPLTAPTITPLLGQVAAVRDDGRQADVEPLGDLLVDAVTMGYVDPEQI